VTVDGSQVAVEFSDDGAHAVISSWTAAQGSQISVVDVATSTVVGAPSAVAGVESDIQFYNGGTRAAITTEDQATHTQRLVLVDTVTGDVLGDVHTSVGTA